MTPWNVLQIVVGLLLVYGLGLASGIAIGRATARDETEQDDELPVPPVRPRPVAFGWGNAGDWSIMEQNGKCWLAINGLKVE